MTTKQRLRIAVQKRGRLNEASISLLVKCGLEISIHPQSLYCRCANLPIDVLFVRDDDIPNFVIDGMCDLGIVGENVLFEKIPENSESKNIIKLVKRLGFSRCRLSIALPSDVSYKDANALQGLKIATTYPQLLSRYLAANNINAEILTITGSVEVAPRLGMADAICDLVATGRTLADNNLREVAEVIKSEAVLFTATTQLSQTQQETYDVLLQRIEAVSQAIDRRYIMFHAPTSALAEIKEILPGSDAPSILSLEGTTDRVAVHVVAQEEVFWVTLERLKKAGASSILVLPIEKMMS